MRCDYKLCSCVCLFVSLAVHQSVVNKVWTYLSLSFYSGCYPVSNFTFDLTVLLPRRFRMFFSNGFFNFAICLLEIGNSNF